MGFFMSLADYSFWKWLSGYDGASVSYLWIFSLVLTSFKLFLYENILLFMVKLPMLNMSEVFPLKASLRSFEPDSLGDSEVKNWFSEAIYLTLCPDSSELQQQQAVPLVPDSSLFLSSICWKVSLFTSTATTLLTYGRKFHFGPRIYCTCVTASYLAQQVAFH